MATYKTVLRPVVSRGVKKIQKSMTIKEGLNYIAIEENDKLITEGYIKNFTKKQPQAYMPVTVSDVAY